MNHMIEEQLTDDGTRRADTGPLTLEEQLSAWLRRSLAGNGFGAPEAAVDPTPQSRDNGTNM